MNPGKLALAATTFACLTLLSFGWSEQRGISLSIASAQARDSQPRASKHVAVHSYRHVRHARRYAPNPVAAGAGLAVGAVNTAGAVAAGALNTAGAIAFSPFNAYASGSYAGSGGYYGTSTWGDYDCRPGYPGCRPYAEKDWGRR